MVGMSLSDDKGNKEKYRHLNGIKGVRSVPIRICRTVKCGLSPEIFNVQLLNFKLQNSQLNFSTSRNRW